MTDFRAIATVTAVLQHILHEGLIADATDDVAFPGLEITSKPLDIVAKEDERLRLNIFLFQVSQNPGFNSLKMPTRNSNGDVIRRPTVALDLHYLLTIYSERDTEELHDLVSAQVMARAMTILEENSILSREKIREARDARGLRGADPDDENYLDRQPELVKISLQPFSLEEMTKLWSAFHETQYRLSVAYTASVLLLDDKKKAIRPQLPVQTRKLYLIPSAGPTVERIEPQLVEHAPDAVIRIRGTNLRAESVKVYIGSVAFEEQIKDISGTQITFEIPSNLTAGVKTLRVAHPLSIGEPAVEHPDWMVSNVAAFVLAPRIIDPISRITIAQGEELPLTVSPGVTSDQKVSILFGHNEFKLEDIPQPDVPGGLVEHLSFVIPPNLPVTSDPENPPYILRVRVDGVDSFVHRDNDPASATFGEYHPSVEVTHE